MRRIAFALLSLLLTAVAVVSCDAAQSRQAVARAKLAVEVQFGNPQMRNDLGVPTGVKLVPGKPHDVDLIGCGATIEFGLSDGGRMDVVISMRPCVYGIPLALPAGGEYAIQQVSYIPPS